MYTLILSAHFQKQLSNLIKGNPELRKQISKTLKILNQDINYPSLRFHKLSGRSNWSVSVTKSIRIILHIEKDTLYLLRIGKHEDVY